MAHDLELTLMLADYHRTRPLLNGEVAAKGIKLQPRRAESQAKPACAPFMKNSTLPRCRSPGT